MLIINTNPKNPAFFSPPDAFPTAQTAWTGSALLRKLAVATPDSFSTTEPMVNVVQSAAQNVFTASVWRRTNANAKKDTLWMKRQPTTAFRCVRIAGTAFVRLPKNATAMKVLSGTMTPGNACHTAMRGVLVTIAILVWGILNAISSKKWHFN